MIYRIAPFSDTLCHYGVEGMRWGVRRYQNYDGTRIKNGVQRIDASKIAGAYRNSIVGGKGGNAVGTARLAANARGAMNALRGPAFNKTGTTISTSQLSTSANGAMSKLFERNIKRGKDKEKTSTAEELARNTKEASKEAKNLVGIMEKHDKSLKQKKAEAAEKQRQKAKKMSDQELRDNINRIKMEREYVSLTTDDYKSGYETAKDVLDGIGSVASLTLTIMSIAALIYKMRHSGMDSSEEAELALLLGNSNFDDDFIAHALDLDYDYVASYIDRDFYN